MLTTRYYPAAGIEEPERAAPAKTGQAPGDRAPTAMDSHEKMQLRAAAFRATQLHPGPVGELLSHELLAWEEFGYVLGHGSRSLVNRLVHHILTTELHPST